MGWVRVRDDDDTFFEPEPNVLELAARLDKASEVADAIQARGLGYEWTGRVGNNRGDREATDRRSINSSASIDERQRLFVGPAAAPAIESMAKRIVRIVRCEREQRHA